MGGSTARALKGVYTEKPLLKSVQPKDDIVCGFEGCPFSAPKPKGMMGHVDTEHRQATLKCDGCKRAFTDPGSKENHPCQYKGRGKGK